MRSSLLLLSILSFFPLACLSSSSVDPVRPPLIPSQTSETHSNRVLWGVWDVSIDGDRSLVQVTPLRSVDLHLNAVRFLETTPCQTCLEIWNITLAGPNQIDVDVTLTHPFPTLDKFTGFDVRGIFMSEADYPFPPSGRNIAWGDDVPRLVYFDGYTALFNLLEFPPSTPAAFGYIQGKYATGGDLSSTLNPYIAYRKDAPRRMFEAGGQETRIFRIQAPPGPIHFGYAVDVSWWPVEDVVDPLTDFPLSANCLEAYQISVEAGTGLLPEEGSQTGIEVRVFDHQGLDTISSVGIFSPSIFSGEISLDLAPNYGEPFSLFTGIIDNELSAGLGFYPLIVKVVDTETDPNLGQIDAWQLFSLEVKPRKGWARTWGGPYESGSYNVAVDGSGYIYVTGYFWGEVDFDPGIGVDIHTAIGEGDTFLSKFDSNGNFVWAKTWGGPSTEYPFGIAIYGSGSIYVSGDFRDEVDFDPGSGIDSHVSNGWQDAFLSKFDSNGNFVWAKTWGAGKDEGAYNVSVDGFDNILVTGTFLDEVDFDPGIGVDNHASNGSEEAYLSKFDSAGNFMWAKTWGGEAQDYATGLATDESNNSYVTGCYFEEVDFDPGSGVDYHASNGSMDIFLSKFDPDGSFVWAKTWGGGDDDISVDVALGGSGIAFVTGYFFEGEVDFDPGSGVDIHMSNGWSDVFLSKFDSNGNFVWAKTWGGKDDDYAYGVDVDSACNVFVTGDFYDAFDFDPGSGVDNHASIGVYDPFLSKFDSAGNFAWARTWGGESVDMAYAVAADESGNAYVAGEFMYDADFDPGGGVDIHSTNSNFAAFLSKFPPDGNW